MWTNLLQAFALVLVLEGLMPLLAPERWREMLRLLCQMDSRNLRLYGGGAVVVGLLVLQLS